MHALLLQFILVNGVLNASHLVDVLIPLMQQQKQKNELIYQQDDARIHTARLTQNFLQKNNYNVLDKPVMSPDLKLAFSNSLDSTR